MLIHKLNAGKGATILTIPIQSPNIGYIDYVEGELPPSKSIGDDGLTGEIHTFNIPTDPSFNPVQMEVHKAGDVRGHIPARICVLGSNRTTYKVFHWSDGSSMEALPSAE
jgi:anaphase-promoting complex subunit 4